MISNLFHVVLLCAGKNSRFDPTGTLSKLSQIMQNQAMVAEKTASIYRSIGLPVTVVLRNDLLNLQKRLSTLDCNVLPTLPNQGLGQSIAHGVSHIPVGPQRAWIIALGDMPFLRTDTLNKLIQTYTTLPQNSVLAPTFEKQIGHPVFISIEHTDKLLELTKDQGPRELLKASFSHFLEVNDPGIQMDIDYREDLAKTQHLD